jgi:hypothetical protein
MCEDCNETKICKRCHKSKLISDFYIHNNVILDWCVYCADEYKNRLYNEKIKVVVEHGFKVCCNCKDIKPITSFENNIQNKDGLKVICIECSRKTVKEYHKNLAMIVKELFGVKQIIPEGMKQCIKCEEIKNISEYGVCKNTKDGLNSKCRDCFKIDNRRNKKRLSVKTISDEMRKCPHCKQIKPKNIFKITKYGRVCPECQTIRKRLVKEEIFRRNGKIYPPEGFSQCSECLQVKNNNEMNQTRCKECSSTMSKIHSDVVKYRDKVSVDFETCFRCNNILPISKFNKDVRSKTGYGGVCKTCLKIDRDSKPRDRSKEYKRDSERMKTDSEYRIKKLVKHSIRDSFRQIGKKKEFPTKAYGIEFDLIYSHIGDRPSPDHQLDHIIPTAIFDFNDIEHIRLAHLPENLRWIPSSENLSKQDIILWDVISSNQTLLEIATKLELNESHNGLEGAKIKESRKNKN